tara:strand:+ start:1127 stop:1540 length:414 start_codon:yes stop_codon:yes gene_type:complete
VTKENILDLVSAYLEARPGFDWHNYYGAPASIYRADYAVALRGLHDGRALLRACALSSVSAATLVEALTDARRLTLTADGLEFTACQYPPTEYRAAACRALADALYRHYLPDAADRAGVLRVLRNVLGARLVKRWFE